MKDFISREVVFEDGDLTVARSRTSGGRDSVVINYAGNSIRFDAAAEATCRRLITLIEKMIAHGAPLPKLEKAEEAEVIQP